MNREEAELILAKYIQGKATADETKLLENWYIAVGRAQELGPEEQDFSQLKELVWAATLKRAGLTTVAPVIKITEKPKVALWNWMAAAVAVIIFGGLFYFNHPAVILNLFQDPNVIATNNDIAPGRKSATLTLGNGTKIKLNDALNGELAKEAGVVVTKTAAGQLVYEIKEGAAGSHKVNTLSTARGETYQLRLPDGTEVFLNAASSLTYPASFASKNQRRVQLKGEGYFQVAKDKTHPFIVETDKQEVVVLGTHFNISAYGDEAAVKTTLLEGSVSISSLQSGSLSSLRAGTAKQSPPQAINTVRLEPGQQATLPNTGVIKISKVETDDVVAWKNGFFMFDNENLKSVMTKVARWYNIEVVYADESVKSEMFYGTFSRFDNFSTVIKTMERTGLLKLELKGNKVFISKKSTD